MVKTTSVISILVWNHPEYAENLLKNLQEYKISGKPYEIFVLDQNSNEKTKVVLCSTQLPIHLISLDENIGFSKGHNLIYNKAKEEYQFDFFCVLNSDIIIEEDYWLDKMIGALIRSDKNAISGPSGVRINLDQKGYCDGIIASEEDMKKGNYDLISGSIFTIKSDLVNKFGLFDDGFSPAYYEDADLNLRLKKNGYNLVYVPIKHQHDYLNNKTNEERFKNIQLIEKYGDYYMNNKNKFILRWEKENFLRKKEGKLKYILFNFFKGLLPSNKRSNDIDLKRKFTEIHDKNLFHGVESISGTGSDLFQTRIISKEIPKLLNKYNVTKFIDAPCGDLFWMQHVDLKNVDYIGLDIVDELIKKNTKFYASENRTFMVKDIVTDILPIADLIMIRDCWVHLDYNDINKCIKNLKRTGVKYLLTTSFPDCNINKDLAGIWRPLNLQIEPFNFPKPMEIINEGCTEDNGIYADKSLMMWYIDELPNK